MRSTPEIRRRQEAAALRRGLQSLAQDPPPATQIPPSRRRRAWAQLHPFLPAMVWLLGLAGFLIPLMLSPSSRHPNALRAGALIWFVIFGFLNGLSVVRDAPRPRILWRGPNRRR